MRVLIVEDDPASRFFMGKVAKNQGCEVMCAEDGEAGLKAFREFSPDMVFSDIMMPKMDGLQLLEKIRQTDYDTVVVINSSMDSPQYTLKALQLHANDYLVKPVMEKDIIAAIVKYRGVLENRTKEREILGWIFRRDLGMTIPNQVPLVGKIVNRLIQETEGRIPREARLRVHLGLVEIITNAIEHGNLGITYSEKSKLLEENPMEYMDFLSQRAAQAPFSERQVSLEFSLKGNKCVWLITDQGEGFDWKNVPDPNEPENLLKAHGRGIMLTRLNFSELEYLGKGNQVRLAFDL